MAYWLIFWAFKAHMKMVSMAGPMLNKRRRRCFAVRHRKDQIALFWRHFGGCVLVKHFLHAHIDINDFDFSGSDEGFHQKPRFFDIEVVFVCARKRFGMFTGFNLCMHKPEIDIAPGLV